jgi:hypothetical protein
MTTLLLTVLDLIAWSVVALTAAAAFYSAHVERMQGDHFSGVALFGWFCALVLCGRVALWVLA